MLLTRHQKQTPGKTQNGSPTKKRRWSRLALIPFWIGLLILINFAFAAWINTDSQFAVYDSNASATEKIVQSMQYRKNQLFQVFQKDTRPSKRKKIVPDAPVQVANNDIDTDKGSFEIKEYLENLKKSASDIQIPQFPELAGGIVGTTNSAPPSFTIGRFNETSQNAGKLIGLASRLSGIQFQDQILDVVSTQVKGLSVVSAGRYSVDGYKEFVVIGDKAGRLYDQVSTPIVSPDGKSVAYFAVVGELMKVILNGQEVASYKDFGPSVYQNGIPLEGKRFLEQNVPANYLRSLAENALQFTSDGQLVYNAWKSRKPLVVVGGQEQKQYDVVQNPIVSPNGSHIAYIVAEGINIADQLTTPAGCNTPECIQTFTEMAGRAFNKRAYTYFAIADGVASLPYNEILDLIYSENGEAFGFLGKRDNKWHAVINGVETNSFDEIKGLQFSADGLQHAFAARQGNQWNIVKNGEIITQLANAVEDEFLYNFANGTFAYSDLNRKFFTGNAADTIRNIPGYLLNKAPNANQVALLRQAGNSAQVVLYDLIAGAEAVHEPAATVVQSLLFGAEGSNLAFSTDGKHTAYPLAIEADGQLLQQMVVNGVRHLPYKSIGKPVLSPTGLLVAYAATVMDPLTGVELALAVINGQESEFYDRIVGELQMNADGSAVSYLAERDGKLEWISHKVSDLLASAKPAATQTHGPTPFPGLFCPPESVFKDMNAALQNPLSVCGLSIPDGEKDMIPEAIGTLRYLKHLNLSFNQISVLPDNIGNLYDLRWLSLVGNTIERLPGSIGNASELEYLDVSSNMLSEIPMEIGNLHSLRILNLSGNNLRTLPKSMESLTGLERLYVNGNMIPTKQLQVLQSQLPYTKIYGI